MSSVLRELEELRTMLESPKKTYTAFKPLPEVDMSTPRQHKAYSSPALNSAEKSVDRLGRAIEAAEEEMEAALRRTNDVHRNQLKQKELELLEMQHALSAKERSLESMRDTLSTTRRAYESKVAQLESNLESKDAEIAALREELKCTHSEMEMIKRQMTKQLAEQTRENDEMQLQKEELRRSLLLKSDEAAHTLGNLRDERDANRSLQMETEDLRRRLGILEGELLLMRRESQATKEHLEMELEDANKKYRSEKSIRKACEKWLKAELKSRDEYDLLLTAIRDTAQGGVGMGYSPSRSIPPQPSARDMLEVERMVHDMQTYSPGRRSTRTRTASPGRPMTARSSDQDNEISAQLADDNRRLKGELYAARKLLQERLS